MNKFNFCKSNPNNKTYKNSKNKTVKKEKTPKQCINQNV